MKRDQRGFSLVELIIVIAIMAVLTTVGVLSFGLVTGQHVKSCAKELDSYIGETRIYATSRAMEDLVIFVNNDGVYVNMSVENQDVKIGRAGIQVRYLTNQGGDVTLSDTERLTLSFDRSSGAFTPISMVEGNSVYCTAIIIEDGSHVQQITLIPRTGKYYIEE